MKIAAYCRVSTDKEDQTNSFESQQRYFREYIGRQPDWELYEVYADEGITGTSTKKRAAFQRMIADAQQKRFDLIITKEVSRFARNTVDTLQYTRNLKNIGIGVVFMNDGINTLEADAELRLSIMSSIAQEESRKTSTRVKWGQARRMEQGVVFGRSMLGYDVKNGQMTINSEGAKIVKLIFQRYVHERKGTTVIARELREEGYKTLSGKNTWKNTAILRILRNEKYCGDLLQKKTITPDYLTHQKKYNCGEEEMIYIRDHHEPIISRALWEAAQREIKRRDLDGKYNSGHGHRYPLSGKIKCSECGKSFVCRMRKQKDGTKYKTWRCVTTVNEGIKHLEDGGSERGCNISFQLRDDVGVDMVKQAVRTLKLDRDFIVSNITKLITNVMQEENVHGQGDLNKMQMELELLRAKKREVLDAFFSKSICEEDMKMMNKEYDEKASELEALIKRKKKQDKNTCNLDKEFRRKVENIVSGEAATDQFYGNLLETITVHPDKRMGVTLRLLQIKWIFNLENMNVADKNLPHHDTQVPISVSVAMPSLKGIE